MDATLHFAGVGLRDVQEVLSAGPGDRGPQVALAKLSALVISERRAPDTPEFLETLSVVEGLAKATIVLDARHNDLAHRPRRLRDAL